ncbi:MAG TPA: hypothetical protein VHT01_08335 [Candidatus Udaeobacter sp.]|jgi:hypothetical protein|nr:hypothetical protein [Candidatus Udaeobacter sp.]
MPKKIWFVSFTIIVAALALSASPNAPWDKPSEQWTAADVFRILQNSPWSPSKFSLESKYSQRNTDGQSGVVNDSHVNTRNSAVVPGISLSRGQAVPAVTVLWWSSKTIRRAEAARLTRLKVIGSTSNAAVEPLSDYVLSVEGDEPLRILRDAKEDLHDTVFLELENGGTIDLLDVKFSDTGDTDVVRTEMHFTRMLNNSPAIDPESDKVIFHCRATAKKEMPGRGNTLSFRVEFSPRLMKAQGVSDL